MNRQFRDPTTLRPLPIVKTMWRWGKESREWAGFVEDIRENGIKHPLQITADGRVVDGETRRLAALDLQLAEVPVEIVPDDEVDEIVLRELTRRRNLTKSQLAYLATPLIEPAWTGAKTRRLENLKVGDLRKKAYSTVTLNEWSELMGLSVDLLQQARKVHEFFKDGTKRTMTDREGVEEVGVTFREFFEPRIMASERPYGLGDAIKGMGYLKECEKWPAKRNGSVRGPEHQQELFTQTFAKDATLRWDYWQRMDARTQETVLAEIKSSANKLPKDQCAAMSEFYDRLSRVYRTAAKG